MSDNREINANGTCPPSDWKVSHKWVYNYLSGKPATPVEECSVCYSFTDGQLDCGHWICYDCCVKVWRCPICRNNRTLYTIKEEKPTIDATIYRTV